MNSSEANHIEDPPTAPFCLVIEDCDHDYQMLERLCQQKEPELRLIRCTAAVEAMELLEISKPNQEPSTHLPQVIVLDLALPGGSDGRVILEAVRRNSTLRHIPIVVFTSSSNAADSAWCYQNGANAYQQKAAGLTSFERVIDLLAKYSKAA